jgi:hypothetical protein
VAVYLAAFRDYRPRLAAGERATVMVTTDPEGMMTWRTQLQVR